MIGGRERADLTIPAAPDKVCLASATAQFILVLVLTLVELLRFEIEDSELNHGGTYKAADADPIRMDLST